MADLSLGVEPVYKRRKQKGKETKEREEKGKTKEGREKGEGKKEGKKGRREERKVEHGTKTDDRLQHMLTPRSGTLAIPSPKQKGGHRPQLTL